MKSFNALLGIKALTKMWLAFTWRPLRNYAALQIMQESLQVPVLVSTRSTAGIETALMLGTHLELAARYNNGVGCWLGMLRSRWFALYACLGIQVQGLLVNVFVASASVRPVHLKYAAMLRLRGRLWTCAGS